MRNISIFATPAYPSTTIPPYLKRGSSLIRGSQMAEFMGLKFNPKEGYDNDVLIYVKPGLEGTGGIKEIKAGSYVDVIEDIHLIDGLLDHPKLKIIVMSRSGAEYLRKNHYKNDVVVIPQHHCNFERFRNNRREIKTVGIIGSKDTFEYPIDEFKRKMEGVGLKLIINHSFLDRQDVVDFYKQVDIQVSWNRDTRRKLRRQKKFKDSLRMKNAASFGIPTVAYPEVDFKEFEGGYIKVLDMDSMVAEIVRLKEMDIYKVWSKRLIKASEKYHISAIAEEYRKLRV